MCVCVCVCAWSFTDHGGCFRHTHDDDACAQHPRYGTTLRHGLAELTAPRGAHVERTITSSHSFPLQASLIESNPFHSFIQSLLQARLPQTRRHSGPANLSECTGFSSYPSSSSPSPASPVQPIPSSASKQSLLKERDIRYESFTLRDNR
ncbi:hypothetical protein COCSADRAFT_299495 [Bipolaris sorokiniana ND90Pr]|uniref:Uncharacterized protein n=1 Tax=Cochliobolus sativus (strain ND90Pr / ATCC 201652) TaxID=665912 RepID=M2SH81_COCSN|nr:uncharacterized protein COCSADRAFT_299495 [Bipolaris sorokiniana ND90Pr]EMD66558.1 hypothetical protein COCSADRAFT_299495 [Bipolaris sorokiniana ND90Pr]